MVRVFAWQYGRHDKQVVGSTSIEIERTTSKAKISDIKGMVILPAKFSELSKAWSSLAYSTGSLFTNSSPGSTQSKNTSNGTTINHCAMQKQHDAIHGMICKIWYAMHMRAPEGKEWSRHQLGKSSMPLEIWDYFIIIKITGNGCTVCKWQAKQEWCKTALNSIIALKMQ